MCHTILVVDDRIEDIELVVSMLSREWTIVTATSSTSAMDLCALHDVAVALVDLRMTLSDTEGLVLLKQIRIRHPNVMRILFSGGSVGPILLHALNSGDVWRFIEKPTVNWEPLRALVREACQRHERLDLSHAIERVRREGQERGETLAADLRAHQEADTATLREVGAKFDEVRVELKALSGNLKLTQHETRRHGAALAEVAAEVDEVRESTSPGIDVAAAMRAHAESLGEHAEQLGTVMGAQARTDAAVQTIVARVDALQGRAARVSDPPPTIASTEAKVDRMKAAMAIGGAAIGAGEIAAEIVKHLLK